METFTNNLSYNSLLDRNHLRNFVWIKFILQNEIHHGPYSEVGFNLDSV